MNKFTVVGACPISCGKCCEFIEMEVNPDYLRVTDIHRWVLLHGIRLQNREGRVFATIPTPCTMLTADKRCGIYEDRPEVCRVWPTSAADLEDPRIKPFCTLSFVEEPVAPV